MLSSGTMIDLLIADDHQVLLDGFQSIFQSIPDIQVIGTAHNGQEVLETVEINQPHVILLDIAMPIMNGVETCKRVHRKYPGIKIIALSMHDQTSYVKRMFQFGASGYLLKNDSAETIESAVRIVMEGEKYLSPKLEKQLGSSALFGESLPKSDEGITEREIDVLKLLANGYTDSEMADQLFLSKHTINSHRKRLLAKFNAKNSAELIKICIEKGLI